jgi:hypothetical protein
VLLDSAVATPRRYRHSSPGCPTLANNHRRAIAPAPWSLPVNDRFRIGLRWTGSDAEDVEIVDDHRGRTR